METVAGSLLHAVCNGRFHGKEMEAGAAVQKFKQDDTKSRGVNEKHFALNHTWFPACFYLLGFFVLFSFCPFIQLETQLIQEQCIS